MLRYIFLYFKLQGKFLFLNVVADFYFILFYFILYQAHTVDFLCLLFIVIRNYILLSACGHFCYNIRFLLVEYCRLCCQASGSLPPTPLRSSLCICFGHMHTEALRETVESFSTAVLLLLLSHLGVYLNQTSPRANRRC